MPDGATTIPDSIREDVLTLWDYNQMHHELRPCDVGIGLGSHDPNVASYTAKLFLDGFFPLIVFSGANAETSKERFPHGEAQHYQETATALGVPPEAILLEPNATNTSENIILSRDLLLSHDLRIESVVLVSRPYQQRRAFATCRKVWPEVEVLCTSAPLVLDDYAMTIGSAKLVIDMLVGDTQRVVEYAQSGFAIPQDMPQSVLQAYGRLVNGGFTSRLLGAKAGLPNTRRGFEGGAI